MHEAFGEDMPAAFQSANVRPIPDELVAFVIAALTGEWSLRKRNAEKTKKANDLNSNFSGKVKSLVEKGWVRVNDQGLYQVVFGAGVEDSGRG